VNHLFRKERKPGVDNSQDKSDCHVANERRYAGPGQECVQDRRDNNRSADEADQKRVDFMGVVHGGWIWHTKFGPILPFSCAS